jgi:hypothetical protein
VQHFNEQSREPPKADVGAEQGGAIGRFKELSEVVHKATRPLPTETGNGTYVKDDSKGGSLWEDLLSLGIEDAKTVKDLVKTDALGRPVDDKTMLMERIIQVKPTDLRECPKNADYAISRWWPNCLTSPKRGRRRLISFWANSGTRYPILPYRKSLPTELDDAVGIVLR